MSDKEKPAHQFSPDEEIQTWQLLKLIAEIFDCIEDGSNKAPEITIMDKEIMIAEFGDQRFRIHIQNTNRFQ